MDTQGNPTPNPERSATGGAEQLKNLNPQELGQPGTAEAAPAPRAETAQPSPGVQQQNAGQPPAQAPRLTADDVAKAIAAAPMPKAPVVATPQIAADQDVVEPEWVDAAEQVITQTAGNPHAEEEAVENLQIDYLKKRYGHEVKKPEEK